VPEKPPFLTETLETAPEGLAGGATFAGRYHIVEELGKGGMGTVYRAIDNKLNEEVALKLIRPEIARDERTLERFQNELKIARKISHRHVGRMYELMEEKGVHFITMEYVAGQDLRGLIRQTGQLTVRKSVAITTQVLEGLAEAHRLGVVHRDLKPSNIIIDREGSARIIDFGIARTSETKGGTGAGAVIGTPEYMAPEQVEGKPADRRADLYALGVILFEMVTGRPPFEGETPLAVAVKHKTDPPPDPRALAPQIPDELGRVILRSLEKDRDKRYQTSEEFLADLGAIDAAAPTTERTAPARKPATSKKITVEFTPKKLVIPAAVLAALVLAAVFLWHPWTSGKSGAAVPKVEHSIAVISFENLTGDPGHDSLIRAVPNLMITKFEAMGIPLVVTWERLRDILKQMGKDADVPVDTETGFEICRREGIAVLVTGEVTKAGNVFVTNLKALDTGTKGSLASASSQGQGEESLFSQIDDLASRVYQKLGWTLAQAGNASPVAEFTTTSLEAYNDFLRGRDLYDKGYLEEARLALQSAIDRDPQFASAYLILANTYGGLRNVKSQEEALEKAKALSGKATEKERLYIEAPYAGVIEKDGEKRFRILLELTAKYPREKRALVSLSNYYRGKKMFPEAIEALDRALELDPEYGGALNNLAYAYMDSGKYEKAAEFFRKFAALNPGDANPYGSLGELAFRMGDLDEAIANYREALKIKPDFGADEWIAYALAVKGEYAGAVRALDDYIRNAPSGGLKARGRMWKAYYYHVMGKRDLAMNEADQSIEDWGPLNRYGVSVIKMLEAWFCYDRGEYEKGRRLMQEYFDFNKSYDPPKIRINTTLLEYYLALLDGRQGRVASAKQRLEKANSLMIHAKSDSPSWTAQERRLAKIVQAEILLAEGKAGEVIAAMEKEFLLAVPGMNPPELMQHNMPFEQDVLARAYVGAGNLDKAIEAYRKLLTFDPSGQDRRIRIPVYHYRLGRLYEETGRKDQAAEQYRIFLVLWKDADAGLPEPPDAKRRLASLTGN
jgi:serine/threonine protein kinase/tetratricopeptide (TPR) repeat protein